MGGSSNEHPRSNIQDPEKLQDPRSNWNCASAQCLVFGAWILELLWSLDLGSWMFYRVCHSTLKPPPVRWRKNGTDTSSTSSLLTRPINENSTSSSSGAGWLGHPLPLRWPS